MRNPLSCINYMLENISSDIEEANVLFPEEI